MITFLRAIGQLAPAVPGFNDPTAARFLVPPWSIWFRLYRCFKWQLAAKITANLGSAPTFFQFRTVLLDEALAAAGPPPQVVILGAGFDGRAWRLKSLAASKVLEVDQSRTQILKKKRAASLKLLAQNISFVAVDFTKDDLANRLWSIGFKSDLPTFWLWEGVAMYLETQAVEATLRTLAEISPQGSTLALSYMAPGTGLSHTMQKQFLELLGEPQKSSFTPEQFDDLATRCGWVTTEDSGVNDWIHKYTPKMRAIGAPWLERIWVGKRHT